MSSTANPSPSTAGAPPLAISRYIGYGLGDFAFNFYWLPLQVFLLKYYTDVLGLSSGVAGTLIMICLIWDGAIDPAIGLLANKTRSRWGRYRPYMLFGCVPLAASFALLFFPVPLAGTSLVMYALATQLLFRTLYAAVNIPYGAMMASMTRDSMERNWLAGVRMFFAFSGSALVGYYTPRLVQHFEIGHPGSAYFIATAILSGCAIVVILLCFALTEEQLEVVDPSNPRVTNPPLGVMLKMIARNTPFLQVMAGIALFSFAYLAVNTSLPYFVQYYMGQDARVTGNMVGMIPLIQMLAILPWTIASRFLGKRLAWIMGLLIALVGVMGLYFIDQPSLQVVYILLGVFSVGAASIAVNFWSMVPDTVEYGEWHSGIRAEGFMFGFVTLIQKVALGLSSAFIGAYLAYIGYVANQAQSGATLTGLKLLVSGIAGMGLVASCAVIYFYRLNTVNHAQLVRDIAARNASTT
jgi:GPH family glycoside/pentoside/hexuronide:cation symporter